MKRLCLRQKISVKNFLSIIRERSWLLVDFIPLFKMTPTPPAGWDAYATRWLASLDFLRWWMDVNTHRHCTVLLKEWSQTRLKETLPADFFTSKDASLPELDNLRLLHRRCEAGSQGVEKTRQLNRQVPWVFFWNPVWCLLHCSGENCALTLTFCALSSLNL